MSTFALNENQVMLAESARKYVERGYGSAARAASLAHPHGCVSERWAEFAEMGWLALPLPEADGGLGGSLADMCVLAEDMGRALVVEPWLASGVLAATLLANAGTAEQRATWLPALAAFAPQLIVISAGFDAHRDDDLGNLGWNEVDYTWLTEQVCAQAAQSAGGRIVSCLEGGYHLNALARSVAAHSASSCCW